jgi:hypothetical protein
MHYCAECDRHRATLLNVFAVTLHIPFADLTSRQISSLGSNLGSLPTGPFPVAPTVLRSCGGTASGPRLTANICEASMSDVDFQLTLLCAFGAFALLLSLGRRVRLRVSKQGLSLAWERKLTS